jgi:hypothetical protein
MSQIVASRQSTVATGTETGGGESEVQATGQSSHPDRSRIGVTVDLPPTRAYI